MLHAWRISKLKHAAGAFSGVGAKLYGGRWNSPGTAMIYTAGSMSLAILEMLVHLQAKDLVEHYVVFETSFDEAMVTSLEASALPRSWRHSPAPKRVQQVGDSWISRGTSAVLRLPSAIVPTEFNYLLNPAHPDFDSVAIGPRQRIRFDPRLIKTSMS
jgi:RES domain-containing protein